MRKKKIYLDSSVIRYLRQEIVLLEEIQNNEIKVADSNEIIDLSNGISAQRILPENSINNRLHIVAALNNLNPIDICSPTMLLKRSGFDD